MSSVFKALAHPIRRRVLQLLRERPHTAGELASAFSVSRPTMSTHFAVLRDAGLVESERRGKTVIYQIQMSVLEDALFGFAQSLGLGEESEASATPVDAEAHP